MPILQDAEFGAVTIRRSSLSHSVRLKIDHKGTLVVSMPKRAPLYLAKKLIDDVRDEVRRNLAQTPLTTLNHGDTIGKSHKLVIRRGDTLHGRILGNFIEVTVPEGQSAEAPDIQTYIKEFALKALRTQAKAYLSRRLKFLADEYDFTYTNVRFSNAGTRWGSCSSTGTISLNIWLMQLPFTLIDYVIVHELCHTHYMNHSRDFWQLVEQFLPDYRVRRRALKSQRPYL